MSRPRDDDFEEDFGMTRRQSIFDGMDSVLPDESHGVESSPTTRSRATTISSEYYQQQQQYRSRATTVSSTALLFPDDIAMRQLNALPGIPAVPTLVRETFTESVRTGSPTLIGSSRNSSETKRHSYGSGKGSSSPPGANKYLSEKVGEVSPLPPLAVQLPPSQSTGMSPWREYLFVFNVCLAQLFSLAGLAQSFAPLLLISDSFGVTDPGQMSWYTSAYSMTLGTFILPAGRLGDMFGHKRIFVIGWIWFCVWSIITGFSHFGGPVMLSICRGFQGIGPALLVPNGIALIGRTFPMGLKRALAMGAFGGCGAVGVTFGVVFSSLLAQLVWWPWSFWVMAMACAAAAVLTYIVIPSDKTRAPPVATNDTSKEDFDVLGSVTGVTGLLLINFALNEAPVEGWNHVYVPILLAVGLLLMGIFVFIELKVARKPILPLRELHAEAALTLACIAAGWASHGIWLNYLFLFLQTIRVESPLLIAAQFWPVSIVGFSAAIAGPFILRKVKVPYLMSVAMVFFCIAILLLVTAPAHQSYWINTFISILLAPFAMNWSFPSATILMSNAVSKQHQGIAASLVATMVNYSIATGLGLGGTINRYMTPKHGVLGAYRDVWWLGLAFAATGFVISLYFIWQTRTRKPAAGK